MKLKPIAPPTPSLDMSRESVFTVILNEGGFAFPLLDYSIEPSGKRYKLKTFSSVQGAIVYATAEGHRNFSPVQIH